MYKYNNKYDFVFAMSKIKPSVSQADLGKYQDWTKSFGQEGWNM